MKSNGNPVARVYTSSLMWLLGLTLSISVFHAGDSHSCTIAVSTDGQTVMVGNNEDYVDPRTGLWFVPATNESFGQVFWGYDRFLYPYQGGMNDQGLFIDINAIPETGWRDRPTKPNFDGDVIEKVLTRFGTVDEAVRFFQEFDVDLGWVKYVVVDADGNSAIIEWLDDEVHVIRRDGLYQISTNYLSPLEPTEPRYQIAEKILSQPAEPSVTQMRRVLSATAYDVNEIGQTLYSTICDLKRKTVNVYHFHNFEEVVIFDLLDELEKGGTEYKIPELFEIRPHYEFWFNVSGTELGAGDLDGFIEEHGIDGAIEQFQIMRDDRRTYNKYIFEEWALHSLAMSYQANEQFEEAIAIFRLSAETFPDSWEAHRNLAEAYLAIGNRELAMDSYRKASEINPDDAAVKKVLEEFGE
jgi:tetratricopeptide (TPR) repeat protein